MEQLGSASRRQKRSAEAVDELEQRRDGCPDLLARRAPRVSDEGEELARMIDLVQESPEADEACRLRCPLGRHDRSPPQQVDQVEDPKAEAARPVADRRAGDVMLARHRRDDRLAEPRSRDLDHVDRRTRLARLRLARKHPLEVAARLALRQATANPTRAQIACEPCPGQLELARAALRAYAARYDLRSRGRDPGGVRGNVPAGYVNHAPSATAGCRPRHRPRSLLCTSGALSRSNYAAGLTVKRRAESLNERGSRQSPAP